MLDTCHILSKNVIIFIYLDPLLWNIYWDRPKGENTIKNDRTNIRLFERGEILCHPLTEGHQAMEERQKWSSQYSTEVI